jgi:chromatin remodeling complex protein RSC6
MAKAKPSPTKKAGTAQSAARGQTSASAEVPKTGRSGIARPVTPSPALSAIVGAEPLSRAEVTKRVWEYIKRHNLQDAQDRRQINADTALHKVLGKAQVSMFELTKLINQQVK